jgi:5'-methylthioadenosine phosphorylase
VRRVRRTPAQGVPSGRDRVQGLGVLRHRQPLEAHELDGRRGQGREGRREEGRGGFVVDVLLGHGVDRLDVDVVAVGRLERRDLDRRGEGVLSAAEIGVFGGSGFYSFLEGTETVHVETPYGEPSAPPVLGEVGGRRVAFIPRHGLKHEFPPHRIPYKANLWAMKELGVRRIVGPNACGSLRADVAPGHFVICDQLVDRTHDRPNTFYDGPVTTHISFADPYCPTMRAAAIEEGRRLSIPLHDRGTVVVIEGPRFSTRAESAWFKDSGWEVINMTQYPEAVLARELEICYANISLITDYDVGVEDVPPVTHEEVIRVFEDNNARLRDLLFALIPALPAERDCPCATALSGARFEVP